MQKQRIIILGPAHPYRGGIADTNEAMCRAMNNAGHDARLITFRVQYPDLLFPGKTQYSTDPKPDDLVIERWMHAFNPLDWSKVAKRIAALKPDVVLVRFWLPLMAPCLGTIARGLRKRGVKVIGLTDNVIPHEKRFLDKTLTRYFLHSCHAFMALSKAVESDLKALTPKPTTYFPHPINDQLGASTTMDEARQALNLDPDGRYLMFFGIVRKYKGLDILLRALAEPAIAALDLKLIVAGEFYDDPQEYRELIADLGLTERVILHNEFIPSERVKYYFCGADLVVQTYRSATQSGITQMALHFDAPVLVTRVGGLEEFVKEGVTGLFADPNPADVAQTVASFYDLDRSQLVESIRQEKKRFSWDAFVEHFSSFIQQIEADE